MKKLESLVPPGVDGESELYHIQVLWGLTAVNVLFRILPFLYDVIDLWKGAWPLEPFWYYYAAPYWIAPLLMVIPTFALVALIYLAAKVLSHYRSYRRGARSDYTMRRLPDPWERHRRAWALPLFGLIGLVIVYALSLGLCVALYFLLSPGYMHPRLF